MDNSEMNIRISDIREKLMECWKEDVQTFKALRDECGSYVFDAVMAVILGGTGTSKAEQKAYVAAVFNKMDVSSWKVNAGLKSNKVSGTNYSQRGFFDFPEISNKQIQVEFNPEMLLQDVKDRIKSYSNTCFRKNARNAASDPVKDFIVTLNKIIQYAELSVLDVSKSQILEKVTLTEPPVSREENTSFSEMKDVLTYLQQDEPEIADSLSHASELLLSELDNTLKALRKRHIEAEENDDDALLNKLTGLYNCIEGFS